MCDENKLGFVYFVGAGPYDHELIAIKGANAIKRADVIVYDYLANIKLLEFAKPNVQKIYVGKKAGNHAMKQEDINQLLVDKAREGYCVVRLKGGDPYVFGRGGEEAEILYQNNIKFEVISGISSSIAAPAYAGIPLTFRDIARSFHVMTGHDVKGYRKWNWEALVQLEGTLVFLMSIGNLKNIMDNLMLAGKNKQTAVAVIRWGSSPQQKTVVGTIENIHEKVVKYNITPPGIIVVGDVVHKREILSTFEKRALHGKKIVVTRARTQKSKLCEMLYAQGADVIEIPTIKIDMLKYDNWIYEKLLNDDGKISINNEETSINNKSISINNNYHKHNEIEYKEKQEKENKEKENQDTKLTFNVDDLKEYTWLVTTSANGVKAFMDGIFSLDYDARALSNVKIACIGSETAKMLEKYGIKADLLPSRAISESMAQALAEKLTQDDKVLIIRGNLAKDIIKNNLENICQINQLTVYNTLMDDESEQLLKVVIDKGIDAMVFTSSSTVNNLLKLLNRIGKNEFPVVPCFSIGEKTSKTLKQYTDNIYEADNISLESLVESIVDNLGNH